MFKTKKPLLIVLLGNIGSGKSSLTSALKKKMETFVVSKDSFRYMFGGGEYIYDERIEKNLFILEDDAVVFLALKKLNIIVDDCSNLKRAHRSNILKTTRIFDYYNIAIELPRLSKKESVDRRMNNPHGGFPRKVWEGVWDKFDATRNAVLDKEEFDEVITLKTTEELNDFVNNLKEK